VCKLAHVLLFSRALGRAMSSGAVQSRFQKPDKNQANILNSFSFQLIGINTEAGQKNEGINTNTTRNVTYGQLQFQLDDN
jgi:hypothetical protein